MLLLARVDPGRYDAMMQSRRHRRTADGPVLVLDPVSRHAVAAVRGLGRAGWEVVVAGAETRRDALAAWSRYAASPYERIPDPHGPAEPAHAALARVVERRGCQAIVAVSDSTMARLQGLALGVPTVPRFDAGFERVIDKVALAAVCASAGVMYPPTWATAEAAAAGPWPRIVKPRRTSLAGPDAVVGRTGAFVAHDEREQDAAIADLRAEHLEPIIQARVERSEKVNVSVVRRGGRSSFRVAYQVLLEYPPLGGQAAALVGLDARAGIGGRALDAAERVCDAAGYDGLANVEFYRQEDGELCLIEVNPRVWGSTWFPECLGLRPVERAVLDVLGEDLEGPLSYRPGRRFHRPSLEARWLAAPRRERGPVGALPAIVRPWDVFDFLSVTDPLPVAAGLLRVVTRAPAAISGRMARSRR